MDNVNAIAGAAGFGRQKDLSSTDEKFQHS